MAYLLLRLAQDLASQSLERLPQRAVRNVSLMLVEFPRNEQAARRGDRSLYVVDDRGLANTGINGYQRSHGSSADDNALEGVEQLLDLPVTTVQSLGNAEPVRRIVCSERKPIDASERFRFFDAA